MSASYYPQPRVRGMCSVESMRRPHVVSVRIRPVDGDPHIFDTMDVFVRGGVDVHNTAGIRRVPSIRRAVHDGANFHFGGFHDYFPS